MSGADGCPDFRPAGLKQGQRLQLRVVVRSLNPPDNDSPDPCRGISTLEIFDAKTGKTNIVMQEPPEPD